MKELYNITPKTRWRLILVLGIFMSLMIISEFAENYNLRQIHKDFDSMYSDRLIPAAEIYFISEYLYQKRLLLEVYDADSTSSSEILNTINERDKTVDSLLHAYEATHLVQQETLFLAHLKDDLQLYSTSEEKVVNLIRAGSFRSAKTLFETETRQLFARVIYDLHALAQIQPTVGAELFKSSNHDFASNNLLFYLRFALIIICSVFMLILIRTSQIINHPYQKFRMN